MIWASLKLSFRDSDFLFCPVSLGVTEYTIIATASDATSLVMPALEDIIITCYASLNIEIGVTNTGLPITFNEFMD